jgi:hypothetical protein
MDAMEIENRIMEDLREHGTNERRSYLGMSGIGGCPRKLYFNFLNGPDVDDDLIRYSYTGYLHEYDLKKRLERIGVYEPESGAYLEAPFNPVFKGHEDGKTRPGVLSSRRSLLEIKSVGDKGYREVVRTGRPKEEHRMQVQTYMRYDPETEEALLVYINRDNFLHKCFVVHKDELVGEAMEQKAKRVLEAIAARTPPPCECGWCRV